ncbi:thiamine pyrophosphate enzyme, N-terminal TPP binding domain-domain-containing protein [Clohesyomyces aquaticus]|uniref:2-hydroxyacyl-CoA lyase n=1 Tax=Clohesyomyces aquaticus TaxID=1231657 RepID=A0A1Y1ZD56_9PLEO|nr:thiamine pyrophosphate enzyme, N-terminal TPP binding domain-domain-containing protein [Clohesyomyces aquaticus]
MSSPPRPLTGAHIIARTLRDLKVQVIFGIVGVPVSDIAEQAINLGIRFIGFRNEQAASYAATAYGYLTGRPGVCLVVGGPGVLHAIAGIGNASANSFPLLLLSGSTEMHLTTKGAFQELDSISLLTPHTKLAVRAPSPDLLPHILATVYRHAFYGRPGPGFVDIPADIITAALESPDVEETPTIAAPPTPAAEETLIARIASLIKSSSAPLLVLGKGSAYSRAESAIRALVTATQIPFLPTPMGKGIVPDSHPQNVAAARSAALKGADLVVLLGARLNWILHFGEEPKWNKGVRFVQVDVCVEELGRNAGVRGVGVFGDVGVVVRQLVASLGDWKFDSEGKGSVFMGKLNAAREKNEKAVRAAAQDSSIPLSYSHAFEVIKTAMHELSPPEDGGIVYVAEGANTMDISRSIFPVEYPRLRLDAGSYATMGVGLAYAIAAWEAYNGHGAQASSGPTGRKKVVAIEGDSAFGFSGMEVETMARFGMDVLIFVINNGGIYFGDSDSAEDWSKRQEKTVKGEPGLRSWALGWEVKYEKMAEACGGLGYFVRTPDELRRATIEGFRAKVPVVVNVIIQSEKVEKPVSGSSCLVFLS